MVFLTFLDNEPSISAQQWRVFKGGKTINKYGPLVAAQVLQNSPETALKSYSGENDETAAKELSRFFSEYRKNILAGKNEKTVATGVGRCIEPNKPQDIRSNELVQANCQREEGCLYCKQFRVVADKEDIYKLLSYRTVLKATLHKEGFNNSSKVRHSNIINRIDEIVQTILETNLVSQNEIKRIRQNAEEHDDLYPYWQKKMELLIELGVIQ